jgi:hypothetical protein
MATPTRILRILFIVLSFIWFGFRSHLATYRHAGGCTILGGEVKAVIAITVWAILRNHRTLSPHRSEMSGHKLIAAIAR